jgi:hypothetical protein
VDRSSVQHVQLRARAHVAAERMAIVAEICEALVFFFWRADCED